LTNFPHPNQLCFLYGPFRCLTLVRQFDGLLGWRCKSASRGAQRYPTLKLKVTVVLGAALAIAAIAMTSVHALADDYWEAVPSSSSVTAPAPMPAPAATRPARSHRGVASPAQPLADAANVMMACGEKAVPASAKIQGIVAQINGAWGSNVQVYQSIAPEGPHAMAGGCIFYNPAALAMLIGQRLNLTDPAVFTPMLYAIFAHEVGHEDHRDFDQSRAPVPNQIKELEADRFAGYTLEKLNVPATGLAPYWSMTGDEFGRGDSHGTSAQRVGAFKEGWHEAEWNRAEDSTSVTAATQESIAPEDSTAAP
jgi:hypothetical protein